MKFGTYFNTIGLLISMFAFLDGFGTYGSPVSESGLNGRMAAIACLTHYKRTFRSYLLSNLFDGTVFEESDNLNDIYCALHVRFLAFKNGVTFVNYVHHFNHLTQNIFDPMGKRFGTILKRIGELLMNFFQTGIEQLLFKLRIVLKKTDLPTKRKTSCLDFIASNFEDPVQNNRIFNKITAAINIMLWWAKNHSEIVNKIDKNLDMSKYYTELAKLEEKSFGKATRSMDELFAALTTMPDKDYREPLLPYFPTVTVLWLQMSKYNLPNDDQMVEDLGHIVDLIRDIEFEKILVSCDEVTSGNVSKEVIQEWRKEEIEGNSKFTYNPDWSNLCI